MNFLWIKDRWLRYPGGHYLIHKKTDARNGKRVKKTHPLHHSLREFLIHLTLLEPPVEPQVFFCMSGWNREVPLLSCCGFQKGSASGWWFQRFFISTPIPGEMIQFDYIIFFRWVVISSPTIVSLQKFVLPLESWWKLLILHLTSSQPPHDVLEGFW